MLMKQRFVRSIIPAFLLLPLAAQADYLSYNPGNFPEHLVWQDTRGPGTAVGVQASINPDGVANSGYRQFNADNGFDLRYEIADPEVENYASSMAAASFGINRATVLARVLESPIRGQSAASAISLWKDSFTVSGDGIVNFRVLLDGYIPPAPVASYATSIAIYDFGVFRVADGKRMAEFYSVNFQPWLTTQDMAMWLDKDGRAQGSSNGLFQNSYMPVDFDISLTPYLTAGEYEMRSLLSLGTGTNDRTRVGSADYSHTAAFGGLQLEAGMGLASASGMLTSMGNGAFGYLAPEEEVPEPGSLALFVAGLSCLGLMKGRCKRQSSQGTEHAAFFASLQTS